MEIRSSSLPKVMFSSSTTMPLSVGIETDHLIIESVNKVDIARCDEVGMTLFGEGEEVRFIRRWLDFVEFKEDIRVRASRWVLRWESHCPYSGFYVKNKTTDKVIGFIALEYGDQPGQAELTIILTERYEKEALNAIIQNYSAELIQREYRVAGNPLREIIARVEVRDRRLEQIQNAAFRELMGAPIQEQFERDCRVAGKPLKKIIARVEVPNGRVEQIQNSAFRELMEEPCAENFDGVKVNSYSLSLPRSENLPVSKDPFLSFRSFQDSFESFSSRCWSLFSNSLMTRA